MRVYSDVTKEFYETFSEAEEAEAKFLEEQDKKNRAVELRKTDAKLVETKYQALGSARKNYSEAKAEAYKVFAKKLADLKAEYSEAVAKAEQEYTKANEEYQKQLAEFIKAHPEGYHLTLKDGDNSMTVYKSTGVFDDFADKFFNSFFNWF